MFCHRAQVHLSRKGSPGCEEVAAVSPLKPFPSTRSYFISYGIERAIRENVDAENWRALVRSVMYAKDCRTTIHGTLHTCIDYAAADPSQA